MKTGWSAPRFPSTTTPEEHPLETFALLLVAGIAAAGAVLWLTGQVSARLFGGAWPDVDSSDIVSVATRFPNHLDDPARAWPAHARDLVPGPVAFYGTLAALLLPVVGTIAWFSMRRGNRAEARSARWARPRELRPLRAHGQRPGRLALGRVGRRVVSAEPRQSAIVIGPTQTGKTSGFAIPAILEWQGPVVATSIKTDLLRDTLGARSSHRGANTWIYDPTGCTGRDAAGWTPLMECLSWHGAQRVADWLVRAARPESPSTDAASFWYGATTKLLAPILLGAACSGGTVEQVVRWVDGQEDEPVRHALEANGEEEAVTAFEAISLWDERTRGSAYATAQTVLLAYTDPRVAASAASSELRAKHLLDGGWHTAYLCAPAHEQRRLQPLFGALVQEIVAHVYERASETGGPLNPPLLLVLDECANIAPLRDLATLASTGAGQGIQLVSVFQDMAQITAVYGRDRAPTIVSNHRAKVVLSGIADPPTLEYVARLLGDEEVQQLSATSGVEGRRSTTESVTYRSLTPANMLREMRPGRGVLVYGHLPPTRITLRPWFKERRLRRLLAAHRRRPEAALP